MANREIAAHGAGTPGRQETATFGRATAFQGDFITSQPRTQGFVESLLLEGEENAIPSNHLVKMGAIQVRSRTASPGCKGAGGRSIDS